MDPYFLINGQAQKQIPVMDRGLQYGDGLFETIAVINGKPQYWDKHEARLLRGCERLGFPCVGFTLLKEEALTCAAKAGTQKAVLKIILTRGVGGRGYRPPLEPSVTRIVALFPWPDYPDAYQQEGVTVGICQTRWPHDPDLAGIKHLSCLPQVLARQEWQDDRIQEGLMLDYEDFLVSGTMSNVFMVRDGALLTPAIITCGIEGVMRSVILERAITLGLKYQIIPLTPEELLAADEIFLTNSLISIWPVKECEGKNYAIGPVTQALMS